MPLITKPTRITDHTATLIDHIYTNVPEKVINAGIFTADITDHLKYSINLYFEVLSLRF